MSTGTSTKGPTPPKDCPESGPKTAMATAIANSKLLPAAVKEIAAFSLYEAPIHLEKKKLLINIELK